MGRHQKIIDGTFTVYMGVANGTRTPLKAQGVRKKVATVDCGLNDKPQRRHYIIFNMSFR